MGLNTIQQNLVPNEPHLIDLLNLFKKQILLDFNCHHIGTVQSFNPLTQTAQVTINYVKTFFNFNSITSSYQSTTANYPVSAECPVICLGGGTGALTFPISSGDECLILYNDRDIDNWFAGGTGSPNGTARLHSFADAIVLVGLRSLPNILLNYDSSRVVLRNGTLGTTMVGVGDALIKIANATTTLNTLLQSLVTAIEGLTMNVSGFGPDQATVSPTSLIALQLVGTQIATLLE